MAIWSTEIKEIEKLSGFLGGKFPELEKELQYLVKTDDENVALLYSRRCLEVIITDLCECELKKSRGTEPLKGIIDKLQREEKVPSHIIASMHGLNTLSTFGTHPRDFDPEQVKPVLNNLVIIVKWYLRHKDPVAFSKLKVEEKYETAPTDIPATITRGPKKKVLILISGLLVVVIIVLTIFGKFDIISFGSLTKNNKSIAVLPFENLNNDPNQEAFIVGMVEEIIDKLYKIGDLKVIASPSSEWFKNSNLSIKKIARELGAAAIMKGSIRKIDNNVRIVVKLIDAKTQVHMWSQIYDKDLSDIFLIQNEVAQAVARELKAVINPEERRLFEKPPTTNMAAYEAYWRGMLHYRKLNKDDLEIAMKFFELAKEKDPGFALAYAGIGRVWRGLQQMSLVEVSEAAPKAEAAVERAIELDSTNSEVYHLLGGIRTWTNWDWKGGEASYRKAIELNPQNADAHSTFSHLLNVLGRSDEAMKHIEIALDLDPMNSKIQSFYGVDLIFARRYDEAIKAFQKALKLDPSQGLAANVIFALYFAGREAEATEMLKKFPNNKDFLNDIDKGYNEGGFKGAMKKLADIRAERSKTIFVAPYGVAYEYAVAGDIDNAMNWLEKAYEEHDPNLPYLLSPSFDILRDDPRFQELARKMNLPYK
jgi:TolB-like protein/Tfp pilus assembly protein PilF